MTDAAESRLRWIAAPAVIAAVLWAAVAAADTHVVHLYEGEPVRGQVSAVTAQAVVLRGEDGEISEIERARVRRIALVAAPPVPVMQRPGQAVVVLDDDSLLAVRSVRLAGTQLTVETAFGQRLNLPVERIVRILRPGGGRTPRQVDRLRREQGVQRGGEDQLLITAGADGVMRLGGILESIDQQQIVLNYDGAATPLPLARVRLIEMAELAPPPRADAAGFILTGDGSRLAFTSVAVGDGRLTVEGGAAGRIVLAVDDAAGAELVSDRVVALSALEAASVRIVPWFDETFSPRVNLSAAGRPLRLDDRVYEQGLGLAAQSELTWPLDGQYARLTAVAGIDGDLPHGAAELSVHVDGRAVIDRLRLDRSKPPKPLNVDLAGAGELTVRVDFVPERLGVGARVNLCEAVLIRE